MGFIEGDTEEEFEPDYYFDRDMIPYLDEDEIGFLIDFYNKHKGEH